MQPDGIGKLHWFKSSHSGGSSSECVETAILEGSCGVAVRDSKNPNGGVLTFTVEAWTAFLGDVQGGRLH